MENYRTENKQISGNKLPNDIWEPVTAFSNADGGTICLGIDNNNKITGIKSEFVDKLQTDLITSLKDSYSFPIYPDITLRDDNVLQVFIPPAPVTQRPIYSKSRGPNKGAKVRVGTVNQAVDGEWMKRFAIASRGGAELQTYLATYTTVFNLGDFHDYAKIVTKIRGDVYRDLNEQEILIKLRAVTTIDKVSLFGLLAFSNSNSLQEITAPTVNIAVTHYAVTSKINQFDLNQVSLDDKEFNGSTKHQFEDAFQFIKSKLPIKSQIIAGGKRQSYLAVPENAIRETLANSIAHRDYSTLTGRIQIDIYADRIEFINPGRSLVPLDQLDTAPSQTRNPILMNFLRDLDITEHRGRGIKTIKTSLKNAGLAEPKFEHKHDWFVATLYTSAFINNEDQIWLQQFKILRLKDTQLKSLVHMRHSNDGISNSEYREINNMNGVGDDIRAKKDLKKLLNLELVRKIGENKYTRYSLERGLV